MSQNYIQKIVIIAENFWRKLYLFKSITLILNLIYNPLFLVFIFILHILKY